MTLIQVSESAHIYASAETIYRLLSDYRTHHPKILPKEFTSLTVHEGGQGAGTVFTAEMNVMGNKSTYRMRVTELEQGRELMETDLDTGLFTTFTIFPLGKESQLKITTTFTRKPGFSGWLEGLMMPMFMRRIYRDELQRIDQYAQKLEKE